MNDDPSLSPADAMERLLLRAGRTGAPPSTKRRALLVASGAAVASTLTVGGAAAEGALAVAKGGSVAAVKWIGILAMTGVGAITGAVVLRSTPPTSAATTALSPGPAAAKSAAHGTPRHPSESVTGAPSREEGASPTVAAAEAQSSPWDGRSTGARVAGLSPLPHPASGASTLPAELATLEQARAAMAYGETARALAILDGYGRRFPEGHLTPEATVLRIEVLVKMGDEHGATRLAESYLARDPRSPYAERIQPLLATSRP